MRVRCVQEAMRKAYYERDRERGVERTFIWFVEEVGELGEAIIKGSRRNVVEELADVMAWLLSLANLLGVDMEEAMKLKYGVDLERARCLPLLEGGDDAGEE